MKKLTRKSLDELAKIYPVLSDQEQRGYVAGASPTGSVTGTADVCGIGGCEMYHDPSEHYLPPVVVTPGGSSSGGVGTTGDFSEDYYNGVNCGLLNDDYNNNNNSNSTYPPAGGGGGGGSNVRVTREFIDFDKFVAWVEDANCREQAEAVMAKYGIQQNDGNRIKMVNENRLREKEAGTLSNTSQYMQGINLINKELDRGNPLIVGVDVRKVEEPNSGSATDHFVVITGRGYDEKGIAYYTYMETGTEYVHIGCDTSANRFYYNSQTNRWEDPSNYRKTVCTITEARGNL